MQCVCKCGSSARATYDNTESRWKALQNYEMLGAQKYAENVYYHELARSLREFGYTIRNAKRGDFQITEIAPEICERFSKRHRELMRGLAPS
jgi:conjugative relaxase-like TrwC/TraI family protein